MAGILTWDAITVAIRPTAAERMKGFNFTCAVFNINIVIGFLGLDLSDRLAGLDLISLIGNHRANDSRDVVVVVYF